MTPKVSIIITCHDLGAYLPEALASVTPHLDRGEAEVILVDDGSTDPATLSLLDGLDDPRVRMVRQPNLGLAKARNNGIRVSVAPFIVPLDADNRMRPALIERSVVLLEADPGIGVVYGDAEYFGERNGRWNTGPFDFSRLLISNHIDACACFRRSLWEHVGGYDEGMPVMGWEDWDFWLRCSVAGAGFRHVPEVFFDYRVRAGSMIESTKRHEEELVAHIFGKPGLRFLRDHRLRFMSLKRKGLEWASNRDLLALLGRRMIGRLGFARPDKDQ